MYSNMTAKEKLRFKFECLSKDEILDLFDEVEKEKEVLLDKVSQDDRHTEILNEQIYFAKELIDSILNTVSRETRATEIKKQIKSAIESSYFET